MTALVISTGGAKALPLDLLLSSIPSLPRHVLDRLVERAIDRLDEMDGDPDDEPEVDCCDAADDEVRAGVAPFYRRYQQIDRPGDDADAEPEHASAFDLDQSERPPIRYHQPERRKPPEPPIVSNVGRLVPVHPVPWEIVS